MLKDDGHLFVKTCTACINISKFAILFIYLWLQSCAVDAGQCQRDGINLSCKRLLLERLPGDEKKLQGVENLMVTSNLLSEITPQEIARLPATLRKLDLTDNKIARIDIAFISGTLANLKELIVAKNLLTSFRLQLLDGRNLSAIVALDLSYNHLSNFSAGSRFLELQRLDLKFNKLESFPSRAFKFMPNLQNLDLSGNRINVIPDFFFGASSNLNALYLNFMPLLSDVSERSLASLSNLKFLEIRNNRLLEKLDIRDLLSETLLSRLDLSSNSIKHLIIPENFGNLTYFDVSENPLDCDCSSLKSLHALNLVALERRSFHLIGFFCTNENSNRSYRTLDEAVRGLRERCHSDLVTFNTLVSEILAKVGGSFLMNCTYLQNATETVWLGNRKELYVRSKRDYLPASNLSNRVEVLSNGSLLIRKVTQKDGGNFVCLHGNRNTSSSGTLSRSVFVVRLDYKALLEASFWSMIAGATTAAAFFVAAAILGSIRYACNTCSRKEKTKRKGIKEVLEKMNGFKVAQMDRFSAYKSAKMDKLLAFKSATMDQLTAFKSARVGKLRTYKQATMTTILHHMDRMREHYTTQSTKIKENCSSQVDRLRETYEIGCGRLKDYRSQRMERMRENYNSQVFRIREYGMLQMSRLREQYKTQQQYLLKLLELIDVGNCITVLEAECLKTESVIFDADITFDLEPRPIRMPLDRGMGNREEFYLNSELMGRIFDGIDDDDDDDDGGSDDDDDDGGIRCHSLSSSSKEKSKGNIKRMLNVVKMSSPSSSSSSSSPSSSMATTNVMAASLHLNSKDGISPVVASDVHDNKNKKFRPISSEVFNEIVQLPGSGDDDDDDCIMDETLSPH